MSLGEKTSGFERNSTTIIKTGRAPPPRNQCDWPIETTENMKTREIRMRAMNDPQVSQNNVIPLRCTAYNLGATYREFCLENFSKQPKNILCSNIFCKNQGGEEHHRKLWIAVGQW